MSMREVNDVSSDFISRIIYWGADKANGTNCGVPSLPSVVSEGKESPAN